MQWSLFFTLFLAMACSHKWGQRPLAKQKTQMANKRDVGPIKEKAIKKVPFRDVTKKYGLSDIKANHISIVDLNGDNYSDIAVIPNHYDKARFYFFNQQKKRFEQVATPFVDDVPMMSYALYYDFNHDNIVDVLVGVLNQDSELSRRPLRIYYGKWKQGRLIFKLQKSFEKAGSNATVGLIDYNLDGELDLFVGHWFNKESRGVFPAPDQLFKFDGKQFTDISLSLEGEGRQNSDKTMFVNAGPTYGVQICDMDQNGFPDILTTTTNKFPNKLWMNKYKFREKNRYFDNVGAISGYAGDPDGLLNSQGSGRSFAVACADYNNDGMMDVFLGELTHNYDHGGVDKSSVLTGHSLKFPPKFYRTEYFLDSDDPSWHQADRRGVWVDLNNDGLLDLIVDNSGYPPYTKMIVFMQQKDHSFIGKSKEYGLDLLNPVSTVTMDVNRDGKMDILTAQSDIRDANLKSGLVLYENHLKLDGARSVRFYLRAKKSNSQGLNAMVILKVNTPEGRVSYRRQYVAYSYGVHPPQMEEGIHFGLAKGEKIISVKVRWPFSPEAEATRSRLEKLYKIKQKFSSHLSVTLCEDGSHFIGRRNCR